MTGFVSDIQRCSLHDGPGIRTTVFLKGCNMHCPWCHNPETIQVNPEIQYFESYCSYCGTCISNCPSGALTIQDGRLKYNSEKCSHCFRCVEGCNAGALIKVGREMTSEEVFKEVLFDLPYYENEGGLTVSGGEPLLQIPFCREIIRLCQEEGIHTAIETNLSVAWEKITNLLSETDLIIVDIKIFDDDDHQKATGISVTPILENISELDDKGIPFIVRTPLIPGLTTSGKNIEDIADFLQDMKNMQYYELLNYNLLTAQKYSFLRKPYSLSGIKQLPVERIRKLTAVARERDLQVICGDDNDE